MAIGHVGCKHIANHFKQKFNKLFNSVRTSDNKVSNLHKSIHNKVSTEFNLYLMLMITILHIAILYQSMMLEKLSATSTPTKLVSKTHFFQTIS